ncbi:MAG: NAD(P)-dependent alcohol dehydrogenase [Spirochaeta sp.]|nr:NAD(P)-dependent alcohol dehydrogenase [Spirochaeta sp.]
MKAFVCEKYGPPGVLQLRELPTPVPRANEVLIRVRAATVTSGDRRVRAFDLPAGMRSVGRLFLGWHGPRKPVLGTELAGDVTAVGKDVSRFSVGDRVFAFPGAGMGAYAEYRCMPEAGAVAAIPEGLSYEEAATLSFGGATALDFFRKAGLRAGEKVLIIGASGGVGSAAVQLARHLGARVTGVCSGANRELVRSLGADSVIDYTRQNPGVGGDRYDVIMDTVGTTQAGAGATPRGGTKPPQDLLELLNPGGRLLLVAAGLAEMLRLPVAARWRGKRVIAGPADERPEYLHQLADLVRAGAYTVFIDRRYRFEDIAKAHGYVDTGRKRGNVVLLVDTAASTSAHDGVLPAT